MHYATGISRLERSVNAGHNHYWGERYPPMLQLLMVEELIVVEILRIDSIEVGFKTVEALSRNYASEVVDRSINSKLFRDVLSQSRTARKLRIGNSSDYGPDEL